MSLHGRCVPGGKLEQATLPEKLIGRIDHFLLPDHLIDFQQPLTALLQTKTDGEKTMKVICMYDCTSTGA